MTSIAMLLKKGGNQSSPVANWTVFFPTPDLGVTSFPQIVGFPDFVGITVGMQTIYAVTGIGGLSRSIPVKSIFVEAAGEFYNKVNVHEIRHQAQWATMPQWTPLFNAYGLYLKMKDIAWDNPALIGTAIALQNTIDGLAGIALGPDAELDAYTESNKEKPHYLEPF